MSIVFVFGSNLAGHHGGGAAWHAHKEWGAEWGVGTGRTGRSYALPTMDEALNRLTLDQIAEHAAEFVRYASAHPNDSFLLTAVGCGIAGGRIEDIAPLFADAPENVFVSMKLARGLTHSKQGSRAAQ